MKHNRNRHFAIAALAALAFSASSGYGDAVISLESQLYPAQNNLVELSIVYSSQPGESNRIESFDFALRYDHTSLSCAGVLPDESAETEWNLRHIVSPLDPLQPTQSCLRVRGDRISPALSSGGGEAVLARVILRPASASTHGETSPVSFYWTDCRSNSIFVADSTMFIVAAGARDPYGIDISSDTTPPPTCLGLCASCLPGLCLGDTTAARLLRFESTRVPLDLATGIDGPDFPPLPASTILDQNYPNPFNAGTTICFAVAASSPWRLDIFDITGRLVRSYVDQTAPGPVTIQWDGRTRDHTPAPSGLYLYRLTTEADVLTRKMVLLK